MPSSVPLEVDLPVPDVTAPNVTVSDVTGADVTAGSTPPAQASPAAAPSAAVLSTAESSADPAPAHTEPARTEPAHTEPARTAPARRRPPQQKGQGQWGLGHREPQNPNERMKKDDDGLNCRARIENIYRYTGFSGIDPADLRGRFRWWGLYTQRAAGIDGGRTAILEPHELEDPFFMLRVRMDGGLLTPASLRVVGEISTQYARDTADLTDRQNVQYHWIRIEDVPDIWEKLEAVGLSTSEACGDVPRVVLGSPVAGVAKDEIIDGTPAIEEIIKQYIGSPEFSNLPRKFKTSISGSPRQDVAHEIADVAFIGSVHPEHGPGFDLWVGGGLSTNPMLGQRVGAWVPLADIPEVWVGVVSIFRDFGYRRLRTRARLKFLVADWGIEKFRKVLEEDYLKRKLTDGPAPEVWGGSRDHVGVHEQNDGNFYVGINPTVGRVSGTMLTAIADLAESHGSKRVRTTSDQGLVLLDIAPDRVDSLVAGLDALGLSVKPSTFRRNMMACTGIEFCKLAIVETKARGIAMVDELEKRLGDLDVPLTININGCPNACARTQTADIGLKGMLVTDSDGNQTDGFQVHLGGGLGLDAGFGRKLRGHKVTGGELTDFVERVIVNYKEHREGSERFAQWVARAEEELLR